MLVAGCSLQPARDVGLGRPSCMLPCAFNHNVCNHLVGDRPCYCCFVRPLVAEYGIEDPQQGGADLTVMPILDAVKSVVVTQVSENRNHRFFLLYDFECWIVLRRECVTPLLASRRLALDESFDAVVNDFTVGDRSHVTETGELVCVDARQLLNQQF